MSEIIWQDPPPMRPKGRQPRDPRKVAMDANPGRWILWSIGTSTGTTSRLKRDGYESTVRRREDGRVETYARRPEGWTS